MERQIRLLTHHKGCVILLRCLTVIFMLFCDFSSAQSDTVTFDQNGIFKVQIKKTNIQSIKERYGQADRSYSKEYTFAVSVSHETGIVPIIKTKTFYIYKQQGLVFITTDNEIVSGIILKKSQDVKTNSLITLGKNKRSDVLKLKKDDDAHKMEYKNVFGLEGKRYSSRRTRCIFHDGYEYCFRKSIFNADPAITEIKIGE